MVDLRVVLGITQEVRSWTERRALAIKNYNYGLQGMCAKASARLHVMLTRRSIRACIAQAKLAEYSSHIYVIVDAEFIVDVTATQYGLSQVEIRHVADPNINNYTFWLAKRIYHTADCLRDYQLENNWRPEQIAEPEEWR